MRRVVLPFIRIISFDILRHIYMITLLSISVVLSVVEGNLMIQNLLKVNCLLALLLLRNPATHVHVHLRCEY